MSYGFIRWILVALKAYTPGKHTGVASELALVIDIITRQRVARLRTTWHSLRQLTHPTQAISHSLQLLNLRQVKAP